MQARDSAHVMRLRISALRFAEMFESLLAVPQSFVVEADIQVGIAECVFAIRFVAYGGRGFENIFLRPCSGEERMYLFHRHARIAGNGNQLFPSDVDSFGASDAKEMPDGVFDIV